MRFVARGRDCDVFDLGDGTVLRRRRVGELDPREAQVMRHVAAHGYPCPRVHGIDGPDLVLDRVDGPTMAASLLDDPSDEHIAGAAVTLAGLHERLHRVPPMDDGEVGIVHLDLHPENVLLTDDGPVVIDWTNAEPGGPALDIAMTWVILEPVATSPPIRRFVEAFLDAAGRELALAGLPEAARRRLGDPNVTVDEAAAVRSMLHTHG